MIIKRIELTNWGPHKSLKADLCSNVVGVIGGNGHGKSNFLQAIDYGLNGNLNKQSKELYIYNFGKTDGATKATVKIEFSKNGADGVITRSITKTSSSRKLEWEGHTFTSDAEVSAQMAKILGADKAAMANAIFIKQGCLGALVKGTPAERMSIFQKLMNLSFLDSRDNDIKNKIDKLKQGITDYRPSITVIATQIQELRNAIADLKNNIPEDPSDVLKALRTVSTKLNSLNAARTDVSILRGKCTKAKERFATIRQLLGFNTLDEVDDYVHAAKAKLDTYTALQDDRAELNALKINADRLIDNLAQAKDDLKKLQDEVNNTNTNSAGDLAAVTTQIKSLRQLYEAKAQKELITNSIDEVTEKVNKLRQEFADISSAFLSTNSSLSSIIELTAYALGAAKLKLEYLENLGYGQGDCPICGSQLIRYEGEALEQERVATQNNINTLDDRLQTFKEKLQLESEKHDAYKAALTEAKNKLADLLRSLEQVNDNIAGISLLPGMPSDLAEAEKLKTKLIATLAVKEANIQKENILQEMVQRLQADLENTSSRISILNERINSYSTGEEASLEELRETYAKKVSERGEFLECYNAVTSLETMLAEHSARINSIENELNADTFLQSIPNLETISAENVAERIAALEADNEAFLEKSAEYSTKLALLSKLITERNDLVAKAEVEAERLKLIDDLQLVRNLTNKNGLPLAYMNAVFDKVTTSVQDMLSRMGANFTVFKDEDRPCTFKFMRTDNSTGYTMPQEMLSGGQAIRLSLALLIACQRLILPEVGMLVLDEPSSHMDAEGVESLKDLFIQMTSIFHSSETQLIAVDHNEILETAFEKVITL